MESEINVINDKHEYTDEMFNEDFSKFIENQTDKNILTAVKLVIVNEDKVNDLNMGQKKK